jgi:hypothetical protein
MGFRCSLLGHDYGASEVDRDREERGDEVVVTVHEFKTCDRCGTTKTVSENKEVTSIAADEDVPGEADAGGGVLIDAGDSEQPTDDSTAAATSDQDPGEPEATDAPEAVTDEEAQSPAQEDRPAPAGDTEQPAEASPDPAAVEEASDAPKDDAVILDDDDESKGDREYGEWPAHERGEDRPSGESPADWPETGGTDEGHDAAPPEDDVDGMAPLEDDGELVPGARAYPDEDAHVLTDDTPGGATGEQVTGEQPSAGTGITSAGSVPAPDTASRGQTAAPLVCPECETTVRSRDSLRQGDICPECKRGYLTEREHNR